MREQAGHTYVCKAWRERGDGLTQGAFLAEQLPTLGVVTLEWFRIGVDEEMLFESLARRKECTALLTLVGLV